MAEPKWQEILGWGHEQLADLRLIAYSYIRQGVYDVALTVFDALEAFDAPSPYDLQSKGAIYLQIGNGIKALEFLDLALSQDPEHLPTRLNRLKALFMLGYFEEAILEAKNLANSNNSQIANQAAALLLAYGD